MAPFCLKEEEILASWNYLQMRITCKKELVICATQRAVGVLFKMRKHFEVI